STVSFRLYLVFGFAAGMTVVGSLIALYVFNNISWTTTEIVFRRMPAMVLSLRLADETNTLLAAAPRLIEVDDESQRAAVGAEVNEKQIRVIDLIERLRETTGTLDLDIDIAHATITDRL